MEPSLPEGKNREVPMEGSMENLQIKLDSPFDDGKVKMQQYIVLMGLCGEESFPTSCYLELLQKVVGSRASEAYFDECGPQGFIAYVTEKEAKMLKDMEEVFTVIPNKIHLINREGRNRKLPREELKSAYLKRMGCSPSNIHHGF